MTRAALGEHASVSIEIVTLKGRDVEGDSHPPFSTLRWFCSQRLQQCFCLVKELMLVLWIPRMSQDSVTAEKLVVTPCGNRDAFHASNVFVFDCERSSEKKKIITCFLCWCVKETVWQVNPYTQEPTWSSRESLMHPLVLSHSSLCCSHFTLALDLGVIVLPPPLLPASIGYGWPPARPTCSTALPLMWLAEDDGSPPVTSASASNQQPAMEIDCSNLLSLLLWY